MTTNTKEEGMGHVQKSPVFTNDEHDEEMNSDEDNFEPCAECDGHDACRDFGCAVRLGLEHMIERINP
jgi:hypothetical protein